MSWCPKCNEIRKTDENFCAKCGNELIVDPTCPDCKQRYEDGTIQCPKDGAYLVSARNLLSICVKCGKSFNDGTNFCPDDGGQVIPKLLHTETKALTNPQTGQPKSTLDNISTKANLKWVNLSITILLLIYFVQLISFNNIYYEYYHPGSHDIIKSAMSMVFIWIIYYGILSYKNLKEGY